MLIKRDSLSSFFSYTRWNAYCFRSLSLFTYFFLKQTKKKWMACLILFTSRSDVALTWTFVLIIVVCGLSNHLNTPLAFLPSQLDNIFCFYFKYFSFCGIFVVCVCFSKLKIVFYINPIVMKSNLKNHSITPIQLAVDLRPSTNANHLTTDQEGGCSC